jgi:NAD-dependent oxidoreductase involved in siderophore biosynthesis
MPFVIKFVEDGKGVVFEGAGLLTEEELVMARAACQSDPEAMLRAAFALVDLEHVSELRLDHEGVRRLVTIDQRLAKLAAGMTVAIVAPSDHTFGIARMWQTLAEQTGWPIRIVRSRSEAERWIDQMLGREAKASDAPAQA